VSTVSSPAAARKPPSDARAAILLAGPALLLLLALVYVPAALSFGASLFEIPLGDGAWTFVGTGNYEAVLGDADVQRAFVNTLLYAALMIVPSVAIGLGLALLVESLSRGKALLSAVLFLPLTANLVAMSAVFSWIFAYNGGFANQLLALVGVAPVNYLGDTTSALPTVAAVNVWRVASFTMVLFLAGLTTIPRTIHESAAMDGVRGWAKLRRVTLPLLRPTLVLATVVATIQAVQLFDTVLVMTGGGPLGSTETILTVIYRIGFQSFELGPAMALSLLLLLVLLALGVARRRTILGGHA
jgi:multiple sugar transport system permease protein